jgi:drug/metabolite transporter (DMT)-like permease
VGRRKAGIWLTVVSAVSFGTFASFARLAHQDGVAPSTLMFLRFATSFVLMLAVLQVFRKRPQFPPASPEAEEGSHRLTLRLLLPLAGLGAVLYVGQSYSFFTALAVGAPAGLVSLLLYLYPGMVAILSYLFLKERMTAVKVGALAMAVAGAMLAIGPVAGGQPVGIFWGIASAVFYTLYIVFGSRVLRDVDAVLSATVIIGSAAAAYLLIATVEGWTLPASSHGWIGVAGLAGASTLAITAFLMGLERIGPVNASTLSALEPIVTVILAAALVGESLLPIQLGGGAMILAATILLVRASPADAPER